MRSGLKWVSAVIVGAVLLAGSFASAFTSSVPFGGKSQFGLIDSKGNIVLSAKYDSVSPLLQQKADGTWAEARPLFYVVGRKNGSGYKYALYNASGKSISGFSFDKITKIGERIYAQSKKDIQVFSEYGDSKFKLSASSIRIGEGFLVAQTSSGPSIYDKDGKLLTLEDKWKTIEPFNGGLARAENEDGKVGYINTRGQTEIPAQYSAQGTSSFSASGTAHVAEDGDHHWLTLDGKKTVSIWSEVELVGTDHFAASADGKLALLSGKGAALTKAIYPALAARPFGHTLAGSSLLDKSGTTVKLPSNVSANDVEILDSNRYLALTSGGTGLLDGKGNWLLSPKLKAVSPVVTIDGLRLIAEIADSKYVVYDTDGRSLLEGSYESLSYSAQGVWIADLAKGDRELIDLAGSTILDLP